LNDRSEKPKRANLPPRHANFDRGLESIPLGAL
jgi:hypothetical protein